MRHGAFIFKRLLDQLKRRSESKHALDRVRRRDLHIVTGRIGDLAPAWPLAKSLRHLRESFVCLCELFRNRIDERDSDRHVGEDLLVKYDFPFDPPGGFSLPAIENSA